MALFGRRRDKREPEPAYEDDYSGADYAEDYPENHAEGAEFEPNHGDLEALAGPFDGEVPEDGVPRLNLGAMLVPLPEGAQLQVKMGEPGVVELVHVLTVSGEITVLAYAAPRSGGMWEEVCGELADQLKSDGATVRSATGEWGQELMATLGDMTMRVIGVNGPRWMLRAHVMGPAAQAAQAAHTLRTLVKGTVVMRGTLPMPKGMVLPIELPPEIIEHIEAQQGG